MRRFWLALAAILSALGLAMAATIPTRLGFGLVEYNVAFLLSVLAVAASWPWWRQRRFATLSMAVSGAVATATGAAMLYTKDFPYKEWITWWHSWTSFVFALAFLVHWLHNHPRLWGFAKRLFAGERRAGVPLALAWIGLGAFFVWTGLPGVREGFTRENYLHLASWAVLGGAALAYGAWLLFRLPAMRARLADVAPRNRLRALVDASLFLANWGALLTGFALLYFADFLRSGDLKYASKWWHTATSALLLALVAIHVGFNARVLAAHARRYG
ncbi:MAG TPA: hypothetical protein VHH36_08870 [Candidatus Thermoplasmatota archaeon]|nr:hypothetical protein [Candidatus Thermoplasmatota archaeon]